MMHIQSLHIYPIKSLQGINVSSSKLTDTGMQYDRQWVLVDEQNQFLSQRKLPHMACLKTSIQDSKLIVSNLKNDSISLELNASKIADTEVTVWKDQVLAAKESDSINAWFSQQLQSTCRLVRLAHNHQRPVDIDYAQQNEHVSFADGFPLLIVSASSLDLLNSKLEQPVSMQRFRPNIVIDGLSPHQEDTIQELSINNIPIQLVKPCSRCVIPSINQATGEKRDDILPTLMSYRKQKNKIYFGMNALYQQKGALRVNDEVKIVKK